MITVISLGGSIVAPDTVDEVFLKNFVALIREFLAAEPERRFIFVVGGGAKFPAAYALASTAFMFHVKHFLRAERPRRGQAPRREAFAGP